MDKQISNVNNSINIDDMTKISINMLENPNDMEESDVSNGINEDKEIIHDDICINKEYHNGYDEGAYTSGIQIIVGDDLEPLDEKEVSHMDLIKRDPNFDISSENSSQIDFGGSQELYQSQSNLINETESKYLEEQANFKRMLSEAELKYSQLENVLLQKDDELSEKNKHLSLLEKEKLMMKRELEMSEKEKESAVMRYATVERNLIEIKSIKDNFEKKLKESLKEIDLLNAKTKMMLSEKNRVLVLLDNKCQEIKTLQKDNEKLKNDFTAIETKTKWNLIKLKQEMDLRTANDKKIEELTLEISELKTAESNRVKDEIDTEKSIVLEKQLMEQQATHILLKHNNEEKDKKIDFLEKKLNEVNAQLMCYTNKYTTVAHENELLTTDNERQKNEINDLQITIDKETFRLAELQVKLNDLEKIKTQYTIEKEHYNCLKQEYDTLKINYDEQCQILETLQQNENDLLQFNKELTERTVVLQNEISLYNAKSVALCLENENIKKDKQYYDDQIANLESQLKNEIKQKTDERLIMTKHITDKTILYENIQKKYEHTLGDLEAVKKKHSQTIKELNREITQMKKKCDLIKTKSSSDGNESERECNKSEISSQNTSDTESQNGQVDIPTIQIREPSKKTLIERIVRLQQASARQSEKIDFLENHAATLVQEIQKKSKLLQHYMLREQAGALSTSRSDRNKVELAKYGGIMSAIYGGIKNSTATDMTLELSIEINRKLQAVLEDTLLKNITLKENLDTLGLEVDKLTRQIASTK